MKKECPSAALCFQMKALSCFAITLLFFCGLDVSRAGEIIWKGSGANSKWSTAENWVDQAPPVNGDSLLLTGIGNLDCRNDLANTQVAGITFDTDADPFSVNGKAIRLTGNIVNKSKKLQTVNLYINLMTNSTFTTNQGGDMLVGSVIKGDKFGIAKEGPGVLTLSGTNGYLGQTKVNAGMLVLGSGLAVNSSSAIILGGGTLGFAAGVSPCLGALKVEAPSVIDFAGGAHALKFASSSAQSWGGTLAVHNWNGDGTAHVLCFGSDNSALTAGQLGRISFYSDAGTTLLGTGTWAGSNGQVTFAAPAAK